MADPEVMRASIRASHELLDAMESFTPYFALSDYPKRWATYVLSWYRAVPIKAIIFSQSPYGRDIYPVMAAPFSYSEEKLPRGSTTTPSVQVISNDLYHHTGLAREIGTAAFRDSFRLVDAGVILVNESVCYPHNTPESFVEASVQVEALCQLLHASPNVDGAPVKLICMGAAAQRMAASLKSSFRSPMVRFTTYASPHPAYIARKFEDLTSQRAVLDTERFSSALREAIGSVTVDSATPGSMSRSSVADEVRKRTTLDIANSCSAALNDAALSGNHLEIPLKRLAMAAEGSGNPELAAAAKELVEAMNGWRRDILTTAKRIQYADYSVASSAASTIGARPGPNISHVQAAAPTGSTYSGGAPQSSRGSPAPVKSRTMSLPPEDQSTTPSTPTKRSTATSLSSAPASPPRPQPTKRGGLGFSMSPFGAGTAAPARASASPKPERVEIEESDMPSLKVLRDAIEEIATMHQGDPAKLLKSVDYAINNSATARGSAADKMLALYKQGVPEENPVGYLTDASTESALAKFIKERI